jgi:hypothetical protein
LQHLPEDDSQPLITEAAKNSAHGRAHKCTEHVPIMFAAFNED